MNHEAFIEKNLIRKLQEKGFDASTANIAARSGVDHYRRMSQASAKGKVFDDCLRHAELIAKKHQPK